MKTGTPGRKSRSHFVVTWKDPAQDGKVRSLKVRRIEDSELGPTFVALADFVFEAGGLVIDPEEDELRRRYAETRRLHLSIYGILSVEERGARNRGVSLEQDRGAVVFLPSDTPRR
ncbi:MAG: DUF1820 family protein [Deltaproteobacteria bacterium]|nr:DUF1820 family protein [Deltaproteobacteria bacterium]